MKKPLIVIAGPTACGKSAVSVELAKIINGEIISADSMQVYRGMDIGTAKITKEEMGGIKHYLIDCFNPDEEFSVAILDVYKRQVQGSIFVIWGVTSPDLIFSNRALPPDILPDLTSSIIPVSYTHLCNIWEFYKFFYSFINKFHLIKTFDAYYSIST